LMADQQKKHSDSNQAVTEGRSCWQRRRLCFV